MGAWLPSLMGSSNTARPAEGPCFLLRAAPRRRVNDEGGVDWPGGQARIAFPSRPASESALSIALQNPAADPI
jgi:hypothetical protein